MTAFHVVGDKHSGEWLSTKLPALEYRLVVGAAPMPLTPLDADATADVALLTPARTPAEVQGVPLAETEVSPSGAAWQSAGFPAFHDGVFRLHGTLTPGDATHPARAMQLTMAQGTRIDWNGISGAPVWSEERIVGLITCETADVDTVWATSAMAIRRLYQRHRPSPRRQRTTRHDMLRRIVQQLQETTVPAWPCWNLYDLTPAASLTSSSRTCKTPRGACWRCAWSLTRGRLTRSISTVPCIVT